MNIQRQTMIVNKLLSAGLDYEHVNAWAAFVTVEGLYNVTLELREKSFDAAGNVSLADLAKEAYAKGIEAGKLQMQEQIRNVLGISAEE